MAKTTELKKVERFVRGKLSEYFSKHTFKEMKLTVGKKRDGTNAQYKFDAVSDDHTIVANIKTTSWKTSGGNPPAGKEKGLYADLYFLSLVNADVKLLILTHEETYNEFRSASNGKVAKGVKIMFCPLPPELQALVYKVRSESSREMSQR